MEDFVFWKYVRPVDSVRAAIAFQGHDQRLEPQGQELEFQGQGLDQGSQSCP